MEIIGIAVDNYGSSDDFRKREAFIVEDAPGIAVISQQGNEITGMHWMKCVLGIIVHACFIKRRCAVAVFVYVHGEKTAFAVFRRRCIAAGRQPPDFRLNQQAGVRGLIKTDRTGQRRIIGIARNMCGCIGRSPVKFFDKIKGRRNLSHGNQETSGK